MPVRTSLIAGTASAAAVLTGLTAVSAAPAQAEEGSGRIFAEVTAQAGEGALRGIMGKRRDRAWRLVTARRSAAARSAARAIASGPLSDGRRPSRRMPREPYLPQVGCYPQELPGLAAFRSMLLQTFPRSQASLQVYNVMRGCNESGISEHEEGRALDFEARISNRKQNAQARLLLRWLTRKNGYHAKRFGIMYIIFDKHVWGVYRPYWRRMSDRGSVTANHQDHIHFSFGWNGALQRSAYWTGRAPRPHFGPCPVYQWHYAPVLVNHLRNNPRNSWCPRPRRIPSSWKYTSSVMFWQGGSRVTWLQQFLREAGTFPGNPTGSFGPITYQAVRDWQRAHGVPQTGVWDPASQHASQRIVGRRAQTSLEGWDAADATATAGQVLSIPVIVHTGRGRSARTVVLMRRPLGGSWETIAKATTAADGSYTAQLPVVAGRHRYRLTVVETSTAQGLNSDKKLVTAG